MFKTDESLIIGNRFGRLVATGVYDNAITSRRKYLCECDCGNSKFVCVISLLRGASKSCGCLHRDAITTHGNATGKVSPTYGSWVAMNARCSNPNNAAYGYYGGRGVTVCAEWKTSFENFLADMGERPVNTSIDRVKDALIYSKETCRWSTHAEQIENRRSTIWVEYEGDVISLKEASNRSGVKRVTLNGRYNRGLRGEALFSKHNLTSSK